MSTADVTAPTRPRAVVFDVNETLSDMAPLRSRLRSVGGSPDAAARFFPSLLRDGFARTVGGDPLPFADVAADVLRQELGSGDDADTGLDRPLEDAVAFVLGALDEITVHPDVAAGIHALRAQGVLTVAFTNGSAASCHDLLERAGVLPDVAHVLSVETVGPWKPHPASYGHVLDVCSLDPADVVFVAVHPWDLDGAHRSGMRTAWIERTPTTYPRSAAPAEFTATGIDDLARQLLRLA